MSDDASPGVGGIDDWLGAAGFVDAELDTADWLDFDGPDATQRDDPWADIAIELPTLTSAQRKFLLGDDDVLGVGTGTRTGTGLDLSAADAEIIAIPGDPDEIDPFDATDL